jgi:hypothetical protein
MNTDPSSEPSINDTDYVLLTKWAYQAAQQAALTQNEPDFDDTDHTLAYKIASSSYSLQQA